MDLLYVLNWITVLSSISVFLARNAIYSALSLIVTFVSAAFILWCTTNQLFALFYIIIYVGAVAVLILFVIMMLDIKTIKSFTSDLYDTPVSIQLTLGFFIFFFPALFLAELSTKMISFNSKHALSKLVDASYLNNFDNVQHIAIFGQILFNKYYACILIAGIVLLVAMVGAIILSIDASRIGKIKISSRQLARSKKASVFFK